ncbi:cytochrome P450 [Nonomuraea fuscirosea]|uniref:cytochrome P450 n=1 Tax=Nonomuraea fuscirosea TaxID=1291556 RepID=UPI0034300079
MLSLMKSFSGQAIADFCLGGQPGHGEPVRVVAEAVERAATAASAPMASSLTMPHWWPTPRIRRFRSTAREVRSVLLDQIAEAVIKEVLRMYPPTWLMGRDIVRETRVGEWDLRPGQQVMFCTYLVHRDPRWWTDPEEFLPERWFGGDVPHSRYAYFPFGAGPRICLGNQLGMTQLVLATAWLAADSTSRSPTWTAPCRRPRRSLSPAACAPSSTPAHEPRGAPRERGSKRERVLARERTGER